MKDMTKVTGLTPEDLINRHDPHIPLFGPYSKRYIGLSHSTDIKRGLRFDLSVFPGLYRRACPLPNVRTESGYHPWEAAADLSRYTHRHEILWKDRLYCDITFFEDKENSDKARYIHIKAVNRGDRPENLALHFMANLNFPMDAPPVTAVLPAGTSVIKALEYNTLIYKENAPDRHLQKDGQRRGELPDAGTAGGFALLLGGEEAEGRWNIPSETMPASVVIRYKANSAVTLRSEGELVLPPSSSWRCEEIGSLCGAGEKTDLHLNLDSDENFLIDSFYLNSGSNLPSPRFEADADAAKPEIEKRGRDVILTYPASDLCYGIRGPESLEQQVRTFRTDRLDDLFREKIHEHVALDFDDGASGFNRFVNLFYRPLVMEGNSEKDMTGYICCGTRDEVLDMLDRAGSGEVLPPPLKAEKHLPGAEKYLFSREKLAATTLTNVVFPIRTRGRYIRHYTPGRWWDSLYTWDSGCIGIGQLELSEERAADSLNAYLTEPGDDEAVFIHHGSPVATQFFVFQGLWNRTQDRDLLAYFFPRLLKYHNFLMGRVPEGFAGHSFTRDLSSGLIKTWDYFYNSGGWDDYPPQVAVHRGNSEALTTPVISSAFAVRSAKILIQAWEELGDRPMEEKAQLEEDVSSLTEALHRYSWDEESGYFSYVAHDESGQGHSRLRHSSGWNYNCGLDGTTPLVGGICNPDQRDRLIENLMTPGRLWSKAGLSTVDQRAPYFRHDGYWNGAVWMPHQWFIWKSLLDYGRTEEAESIARTALDLWAAEVDESYNCFEHFLVETGRGAGWHHFSGLSAPLLSWFAAYYTPGTVTTGFDGWIRNKEISSNGDHAVLTIDFLTTRETPAVLICMNPPEEGRIYKVKINGRDGKFRSDRPGFLEVRVPGEITSGEIIIQME